MNRQSKNAALRDTQRLRWRMRKIEQAMHEANFCGRVHREQRSRRNRQYRRDSLHAKRLAAFWNSSFQYEKSKSLLAMEGCKRWSSLTRETQRRGARDNARRQFAAVVRIAAIFPLRLAMPTAPKTTFLPIT